MRFDLYNCMRYIILINILSHQSYIVMSRKVTPSIFDAYSKLERPSGGFSWELPAHNFGLNKADVICSGELQELESSAGYSKFYVATAHELMRFAVPALLSLA